MKILIDLYVQFFIIGSTAFGGGYAVLPLINSFV
ncbi:MAG: chromate transporter, partial [Tissierellia bacterium]|nr:chromate transporter [Tissierellia bacterium]